MNFQHVKTGHRYYICGYGVIEATKETAVVYAMVGNTDGTTWIRPALEFFDGRFVPCELYDEVKRTRTDPVTGVVSILPSGK